MNDDLKFRNTPNFLTLFRIVLVPVIVSLLFLDDPWMDFFAALVFGAAALTDWADGYLARKQGLVTVYGKLLDPLADKFLVVAALLMLQHLDRLHPVVVIILICRELGITGLRALASAEGIIIPASTSAKWKTATQMIAIPLMMVLENPWEWPVFEVGQALLYVSLLVSLWSAKSYFFDFLVSIREKRRAAKTAKLIRESRQADP